MGIFGGLLIPLTIWGFLLVSGCDNEFSPFASSLSGEIISLNGFLDINADTQFVRTQIVRQEIETDASLDDGLVVELANQTSGQSVSMTDSLLILPSGKATHLFYTTEPIDAGANYQIIASLLGENETVRTTRIPGETLVIRDGAEVDATSSFVTQVLNLPELIERPQKVSIVYSVLINGTADPVEVSLPYDNLVSFSPNNFDGYRVTVRLSFDRTIVLSALNILPADTTTVLQSINLEYSLFSSEWRTPQLPTESSFFGSAATFRDKWTLSETQKKLIGYSKQ